MRLTALAVLGLGAALVSPASAVEVSSGLSATITVDETAGACFEVRANGTFAGEFTASGYVTAIVADGVMVPGPIAGAHPIIGYYYDKACIPGVWGAHSVSGEVVYTATVVDETGEYSTEVKVCTFGSDLVDRCV